jgi:hypothetical protein
MENNKEALTINERVLLAEKTISELVKDKKELRSEFEIYITNHSIEHKTIDNNFHKQDLQNQDVLTKINEVLGKITAHVDIHIKNNNEKEKLSKKIREWVVFIIIIIGAIVGGIAFINSTMNKINHVQSTTSQLKP